MCGISIFISKNKENTNNLLENLVASLFQLQNRGYDSAGIAFIKSRENTDVPSSIFELYKQVSTEKTCSIDFLQKLIASQKMEATLAIGHTRWATHGAKTIANTHPHYSNDKNIMLVHNGIIENYQELKNFLRDMGYADFYGETDSEVIVKLIAYFYRENDEVKSICLARQMMKGTWGLGIMFLESENIYVLRNGSPMLFGYNDDYLICTSEISGFNNLVTNYTKLKNDVLYRLDTTETEKFLKIEKFFSKLERKDDKNEKMEFLELDVLSREHLGEHRYWMEKEIYEQPMSIERALNNGGRIQNNSIKLGGLDNIKAGIKNADHIVLLGCGTSLNACLLAKTYFERNSTFNTIQVYDASEFIQENLPKRGTCLVFFASQSGETQDLYKNISICREKRCINIGIINVVGSLISGEVDCGVYLNAGREISVASSKSFTSMLVVFALISQYFMLVRSGYVKTECIENLRSLPSQVSSILKADFLSKIQIQSSKIFKNLQVTGVNSLFILGRGSLYPIANEGALKIKEVSYIHAESYAGGALKHGPLALLEENVNVILLINRENKDAMISCLQEVLVRGAYCTIISELKELTELIDISGEKCELIIIEDNTYKEVLSAIVLQLIAYFLSISKDINPDKPRNLAKVVSVQ
jgi:glutamine---fructose-6-phosphate transaminase (isomerizing)